MAKAAGKPVKLVWSREEEFTWVYFRPAGVIDVRSAIDKNGHLTAWEFHNYNSGTSAINTQYDVPNKKIEFHGKILNPHFASYRVPRFRDVPNIEIVLLDRKDLPSAGAGETPIMTLAPAIANAIYAATGARLRSMPLLPGNRPSSPDGSAAD